MQGGGARDAAPHREFLETSARFARYAWPVEYVVRAIKETGWSGFSVNDALTPLANMGQQLFEPPDVNGWETGPGLVRSGGTLARMNFASALATNQRVSLRNDARSYRQDAAIDAVLRARPPVGDAVRERPVQRVAQLPAGPAANWSGSDAELLVKVPGLVAPDPRVARVPV